MRNFYIYRLTFNSYLAGFDDTITDDDKLSAASSLFECINENMSFLDGNSIPVEADPPTRFGKDIVYTRIAKESHTTINAKNLIRKAR